MPAILAHVFGRMNWLHPHFCPDSVTNHVSRGPCPEPGSERRGQPLHIVLKSSIRLMFEQSVLALLGPEVDSADDNIFPHPRVFELCFVFHSDLFNEQLSQTLCVIRWGLRSWLSPFTTAGLWARSLIKLWHSVSSWSKGDNHRLSCHSL